MSHDELEVRIRDLVVQRLKIDPARVIPGAHFMDDLGADSVDVVELLMDFQEALGVTIPDSDAEGLARFGDAVAFLAKRLGSRNGLV